MSLIVDALQPSIVGALFRIGTVPSYYWPDIVGPGGQGGFYLTSLDENAFEVEFYDAEYVATVIAGDAQRLAMASYLSLQNIIEEVQEANTVGWGIVKLYYGAFYAAHCILRILGESCSFMTSEHVTHLTQIATASGLQFLKALQPGLYHYKVNKAGTGFVAGRAKSRKGSHECFWAVFGEYLDSVLEQVVTGHLAPGDGRIVFGKLTELRGALRAGGGRGGSWLSVVRNGIQYRHGYGVWPPCGVRRHKRGVIGRVAGQWTRDPMDVDLLLAGPQDLERFAGACAFIVALSAALLRRIAERSIGGARSFARAPLGVVTSRLLKKSLALRWRS